jgi:hypothetical protein
MKGLIAFLLAAFIILTGCDRDYRTDPLERTLSLSKVQTDFSLCREILEKAHPSLTIYRKPERVNFLFDSVYKTCTGRTSIRELFNKLYYITNEAGCSHTDFFIPPHLYDTLQKRKYFFPFPVLWVQGKLLVNLTGNEVEEGTEIETIDGVPVKKILQELSMYNSVEGVHRPSQELLASRNFAFQYYLKYGIKKYFNIEISGVERKKELKRAEAITFEEWTDRNDNYIYYADDHSVDYDMSVEDTEGYATMRVSTFEFDGRKKREAFANFCKNSFELLSNKKNIKSLIIDVRDNTGGRLDCLFELYSFLAQSPFIEYDRVYSKVASIPYRRYLSPGFDEYSAAEVNASLREEFKKKENGFYYYKDSLINEWTPSEHRFLGNIYVITNSRTVSAGSYLALLIKRSGRGKVVGEETGGGSFSGNGFTTLEYQLPRSGIILMFPYAHMVYSYKEEKNKGRGVIPDYVVPDTYKSFSDNVDIQLAYIIDSLLLD